VPKRLGADALDKAGLWANYAMDRDEKTVLADWYRFAHGTDKRYGRRLGVDLNGYLVGRPTFVVDGDRRGFRFDGRTQYAELCPRVADLGEMTVVVALKWEGKGSQTIFDFGSSADDRLVLRTDRRGRPELVATVGGRAVARASARQSLPADTWVRLRVESDGKVLSLWVDGDKVASEVTGFRPCDVFPAGQVKRNFVAAARDGSSGFKGVVDHVIVYHKVHEDFSKTPAPILDSPVRPTIAFIESQAERYGNIAALNAKVSSMSHEMLAPYNEFKKHCEARQKELLERDEGYLEAVANLAAAKRTAENLKRGLSEKFGKLHGNAEEQAKADAARRKNDELRRKVQDLERERFETDEELRSLQARRKEAEEKRRIIDRELRREFEKRADVAEERAAIAGLRKQVDQLRRQVHESEKEARGKDKKLTALYARRKEIEGKRREAEKALDGSGGRNGTRRRERRTISGAGGTACGTGSVTPARSIAATRPR
ncbi:MAG: LamG-like jellyroll fold domain-containing protein, partial [Planctomycetota bacterium]